MSSRPLPLSTASYGTVSTTRNGPETADRIRERSSVRDNRNGAFSSSIRKAMEEYTTLSESVRSFAQHGRRLSVRDVQGDTTVTDQVFNLAKNLIGAGVLALPSGVAAFADAPSAVAPAIVCTVLMGAIFGYYFLLIGKTCKLTDSATYREAWEDTMGDRGATLVAAVNMLKPALGNLAYSMILADTFRLLFETIGFHCSRTCSLCLVSLVALLPLCLLKNLKVLAPFSVLGTLGIVVVALVMGVRYFDGTYDSSRNGIFVGDLPDEHKPSFGTVGAIGAMSPHFLVLVCMLFEAFVAHYNSPRMFMELQDRTVPRFRMVVLYAFGMASAIYVLICAFGYLTFGANCDGYILNNYSTNDRLATVCRVAIAFAILLTYPVVFIGTRDALLQLLRTPTERQTSHFLSMVSVLLLILVTVIAVFVNDLGELNAVGGGTLATALVFVFPTIMYRAAVNRFHDGDPPKHLVQEVQFCVGLMFVGIAMGAIGVLTAVVEQ